MKVMCIKKGEWAFNDSGKINGYSPQFGEVCTVIDTSGGYYLLAEYPPNKDGRHWFNPKSFIPLSSIDETELVNQRKNINA